MLRNRIRLAAAAVTVSALAAAAAGVLTSAHATTVVGVYRFAGANRYDTASRIANYTPQGASSHVFAPVVQGVLASGDNFPDALSSNFLAGNNTSPIFLTAQGSLSPEALAGIQSLNIHNIVIVGGTSAVSPTVETDLNSHGIITSRVAGTNRDATAAAVATQPGAMVGTYNGLGATALLAADDASHYVDALTGGPLSWDGHYPILLTPGDQLAPEASSALQSLKIKHVIILGGTAAITPAVQAEVETLGITVERLSGVNRQQTAIAIAGAEQVHLGFSTASYLLARGDNYPDALAGGPLGGKQKAPILLTVDPTTLGSDTQSYLAANNGQVNALLVLGGTGAVADSVVSAAQGVASCAGGTAGTTTSTTSAPTTTAASSTSSTSSTSTTTSSTTSTTTGPTTTLGPCATTTTAPTTTA